MIYNIYYYIAIYKYFNKIKKHIVLIYTNFILNFLL